MKQVVSTGLFLLLLYHTLAYALVCVGTWWQAEHDLSEQLLVYHSVDSIVEFQIPLKAKPETRTLSNGASDGFTHRGRYYSVVSLDVRNDTLYIAGLETTSGSFWTGDLRSFLSDQVADTTDSHRKANQLLKLLLKEYGPSPHQGFHFLLANGHPAIRIPGPSFVVGARALPVHSPPPEV